MPILGRHTAQPNAKCTAFHLAEFRRLRIQYTLDPRILKRQPTGKESVKEVIVDTHVHIFDRSTPLLDNKWTPNGEEAPVEELMRCFSAHGVSHGVISTSSIYGPYNDYFRQAIARFPQLRATANMPANSDAYTFEQMSREGFLGIRLLWRPLESTPDLTSDTYRRLLRRCADMGWHVHLTERPDRMAGTIQALEAAGVRVVVDHLGMIDTPDGIDNPGFRSILDAVDRGRTWVKLSGAFRFSNPKVAKDAARVLVDAGGWDRLMWGSDWPFVGHMNTVTYADTLAYLSWVPDLSMRRCIASTTALAFYFADTTSIPSSGMA